MRHVDGAQLGPRGAQHLLEVAISAASVAPAQAGQMPDAMTVLGSRRSANMMTMTGGIRDSGVPQTKQSGNLPSIAAFARSSNALPRAAAWMSPASRAAR